MAIIAGESGLWIPRLRSECRKGGGYDGWAALTEWGGARILGSEAMLGGEPAVPCTRNPL